MLNTIDRAGTLLSLFTEDRVPRSTAHALMSSLTGIGLLAHIPGSRYRLGWQLLTLSGRLLNTTDVARLETPVLAQLAHQLRHTVTISTWDNGPVCRSAKPD